MSDQQKSKEYTNGELTVVWKPGLCIHSAKCVEALPEVYHPKEKPWIKPNNPPYLRRRPHQHWRIGQSRGDARRPVDRLWQHPSQRQRRTRGIKSKHLRALPLWRFEPKALLRWQPHRHRI